MPRRWRRGGRWPQRWLGNDRYLREFIESLSHLSVRPHLPRVGPPAPWCCCQRAARPPSSPILELSRGSCDDFEVGLLILPPRLRGRLGL